MVFFGTPQKHKEENNMADEPILTSNGEGEGEGVGLRDYDSEYVSKLSKVLENVSTTEKKILLLQKTMALVSSEIDVNPSKLTNGTIGELVACEHLGLTWMKTNIHGHDATDSSGNAYEIKTFEYKKLGNHQINVNYSLPAKKTTETIDQYVGRVQIEYGKITAHYWVALRNRKTEVHKTWRIDGDKFAFVMGRWIRRNPRRTRINFGCQICPDCYEPHRVEEVSQSINKNEDWSLKVPIRCQKNNST